MLPHFPSMTPWLTLCTSAKTAKLYAHSSVRGGSDLHSIAFGLPVNDSMTHLQLVSTCALSSSVTQGDTGQCQDGLGLKTEDHTRRCAPIHIDLPWAELPIIV